MQHRGKGEVTGAVCCKARKTHKKSEPGLLAVRRELCQHGLAAGLAQVPSRASAVSPKPHRFHLVPPPGCMLVMCMCCPAWVHPSLQGREAEPPPSWKQTQRHIPNAGAWAEKPVPLQGRAHAEQHEVTVSATETRVSDDRSVMIYSENSPIKNTLEDPAYCLVPFKHSTAKAVQFAG